MSVDVQGTDSGQPASRVAAALAASEIPPSKLGPARRARLSATERELYFWILRRFATDGRPSGAELHEAARQLGLDADSALEKLAREDLAHRGAAGEIAVAYPFSGRPLRIECASRTGMRWTRCARSMRLGSRPCFGRRSRSSRATR